MKHFVLPVLLVVAFASFAQQEVRIHLFFKPGNVYRTVLTGNTDMAMDFTGDQAKIDQMKSKGLILPLMIKGVSESITVTTTGERTSDNRIPVRMVYEKMTNKNIMNEKETVVENPATGLIVEGSYNSEGNKMTIDTLISDKLDDGFKNMLRATIENVQQLVIFPETPLKVGDSFEQKVPMEIPMPGVAPIKILINTTYNLKSIENSIAKFDFKQTVQLGIENPAAEISASGGGTGTSEYDITMNVMSTYESDLKMNMEMKIADFVIKATIDAKSKQVMTMQ